MNKSIVVTPHVIEVDLIPAFRQLSQVTMPGKLAYAIGKNMQHCMAVIRKCEKERARIAQEYIKFDEQGRPIMIDTASGKQPELLNESSRAIFNQKLDEAMNMQYTIEVHEFDEKLLESMPHFTPIVMVAMEAFFAKKEEVPEPVQPSMSVVKEEQVPLVEQQTPHTNDTPANCEPDAASNEDQADQLDLRIPAFE